MSNTVKSSFSDDYKKGAKQFFGGDFSKMDDARRVALREDHFRHMELELASLKKRFYEGSSFEDKRITFEKIERTRVRNLEMLKLIYERRGKGLLPGSANNNPVKEDAVDPAAENALPPRPVPVRNFQ